MKRLTLLVMPLMAVSLLASCGLDTIYTVTFDTDGGSIVEPVKVKKNSRLTKPNNPTKEPLTEITYTFQEWQLDGQTFDFNTPIKSDITLKAIYSESPRLYTVTFDPDGGTPVDPIKTEYNTLITPPDEPSKPSSAEFSYEFNEWQLNGQTFNFNTPIKSDITLKADWTKTTRKYTVYFNSNDGTAVAPIATDYNTTIDKPTDPSKSDEIWIYAFAGWYKEAECIHEFDFTNTPIVEDITLFAKWEEDIKQVYKANAKNGDHLSFTSKDDKPLTNYPFNAGEDFVFKMKAINDSNDSHYVVPTTLNIRVKSEQAEPLVEGYVIEPNPHNTEANVKILASKVVGNIYIMGNAVLEGNYHYDVPYVFGLEEIASGEVTDIKSNLTLTFAPKSGTSYSLPEAENIYIQFDNVEREYETKWVSPNDEGVQEEYCSYEPSTGQLTIKPNHIKNNILVVARAHNYDLLESLSWDDINEIAFAGLAPLAFYLGEGKNITLKDEGGFLSQSFSHRIRIIGFNHDKLSESTTEKTKYAKITFEFTNVITNLYDVPNLLWNAKSTPGFANPTSFDYPNSTLNDYLNHDIRGGEASIYLRLPDELRPYVKTIDKNVMISVNEGKAWNKHEYKTKLFPLSAIEMSRQIPDYVSVSEGTTYQYYVEHEKDKDRFKKTIAWGAGLVSDEYSYWIRSPYSVNEAVDNATCIYYDEKRTGTSNFAHSYVSNPKLRYSVAPAFCI